MMVVFAFVASVALTGFVGSLVSVDTNTVDAVNSDYHFVPAAGSVFGA